MIVYFDPATETAPTVIQGAPPLDQSAELAAAQQRIKELEELVGVLKLSATQDLAAIDAVGLKNESVC